jgi:hypothetical protein
MKEALSSSEHFFPAGAVWCLGRRTHCGTVCHLQVWVNDRIIAATEQRPELCDVKPEMVSVKSVKSAEVQARCPYALPGSMLVGRSTQKSWITQQIEVTTRVYISGFYTCGYTLALPVIVPQFLCMKTVSRGISAVSVDELAASGPVRFNFDETARGIRSTESIRTARRREHTSLGSNSDTSAVQIPSSFHYSYFKKWNYAYAISMMSVRLCISH